MTGRKPVLLLFGLKSPAVRGRSGLAAHPVADREAGEFAFSQVGDRVSLPSFRAASRPMTFAMSLYFG